MATLSNPTLQIDILTNPGMATVTTTVNVQVYPDDWLIPGFGSPSVTLRTKIMGEDGYWDQNLLSFSDRQVTRSGLYTFSTTVPSSWLNEDIMDGDEIYTNFKVINHVNPLSRYHPQELNVYVAGEFGL